MKESEYKREDETSLERKKYGREPGRHMRLNSEEQAKIQDAIENKTPEDFEIEGSWSGWGLFLSFE